MNQYNSIVAFQKLQFVDSSNIYSPINGFDPRDSSYERADKYYALSSLVSNITLQSRYIVPPDISLFILGEPNTRGPKNGTFIGPSGVRQYVYEFPDLSSWKPPPGNKTQIINWEGSDTANLNDPGIKWGKKGEQTEFEDLNNGLAENLNLPKVIKSRFTSLEDTQEFIDISKRIGKIEQFLSNFSTTTTITPQSNFYLGLSGDLSKVLKGSGNWKDISNAGLWRQLV